MESDWAGDVSPAFTHAETKTTLIGRELLPEKSRVYHFATLDHVFNRSTSFPRQKVDVYRKYQATSASAIFTGSAYITTVERYILILIFVIHEPKKMHL